MDWLDDLAAYMQANGLGTVGTDIFKYGTTDAPVTQYGLIPSGGLEVEPGDTANVDFIDFPTVQVRSRATSSQLAASRALLAYELFRAIAETTIGATMFRLVRPIQYPFVLEYERTDTGQYAAIVVFNAQIEVTSP